MAFREIDDDIWGIVRKTSHRRSRTSAAPGVTVAGHEKSEIFLTGERIMRSPCMQRHLVRSRHRVYLAQCPQQTTELGNPYAPLNEVWRP